MADVGASLTRARALERLTLSGFHDAAAPQKVPRAGGATRYESRGAFTGEGRPYGRET